MKVCTNCESIGGFYKYVPALTLDNETLQEISVGPLYICTNPNCRLAYTAEEYTALQDESQYFAHQLGRTP